jgi:hypothetical protein
MPLALKRPIALVLAINAIAVLVYVVVASLRLDGCDAGDSAAAAVVAAMITDIMLSAGLIAFAPRFVTVTRRQAALALAVALPAAVALAWLGFAAAPASGCAI